MATVKGAVLTALTTGGLANLQASGKVDGRVKVMIDTYTPDGTEAAGTVIQMGKALPEGAKVLAIVVHSQAQGGSTTVSVGDGASASRHKAATSVVSAGSFIATDGVGYVVGTTASDDQIALTTAASTLTSGAAITVAILYTQD